jgi:NRAMP (natural resistance-associated macrophage protein)-like metal ion transporter
VRPDHWRRVRAVAAILAFVGPGVITGAAGDDAGGVATYASIGAQYGYTLLWAMGPITVALIVIQVMVARMGVVTGKGFAELIREEFGVKWTAFAMLVLIIANGTVTIAEFAGIAAAGELVNLPRPISLPLIGGELVTIPPTISVPLMAVVVWLIVVGASYTVAEKIFILLSTALLTYVGAAFLAHPDWSEVGLGLVTPSFIPEAKYLTTFVALVGTTITPYMLFYLQSSISDKGVRIADYAAERTDVVLGSLLTTVIAVFIIVSTAATLHTEGILVDTPENAARALEPLAGPYARVLFGVGLFGASMLAACVVPLSTAYAVCGAFGWERGVSRSWTEAPIFNGLYTALIAIAAAFVLIPGLPLIQVIVATQFLNGLLLPIVLIFVLRLVNDRDLMGEHTNNRIFNILSYGTTAVLILLTIALLVFSTLGIG